MRPGASEEGQGPSFEGLTVERFPADKVKQLAAILPALQRKGFTVAVLDTAGVDNATTHVAMQAADLCLMPARPSRLDIEATGATFRAVVRMEKGSPSCSTNVHRCLGARDRLKRRQAFVCSAYSPTR